MKKMILKAMAIFMGLAMSMAFSACGDDNDEPAVPQKKTTDVVVNYSLSLSEDYYDLWDIEVTYTGAGGRPVTEKITMDWNLELDLKTADEIPTRYSLSAVARPKATAPALVADKVYDLTAEYQLTIATFTADGKPGNSAGMLVPVKKSLSTDGAHLTKAVTESRNICDVTYDITID